MHREDEEPLPQACLLLADLFLRGVTEEALPLLETVPEVAAHLPSRDASGLDVAAADHHQVFQLELPPYASVFLEPEGTLGGGITRAIDALRVGAGLPAVTSETPDHLGRELELLATVYDSDPGGALALIEDHMLWWLPQFVVSMEPVGLPLWSAISRVALDVVVTCRSRLSQGSQAGTGRPEALTQTVPDHDTLSPSSGGETPLRELGASLLHPLDSGAFLTPSELRAIGREHRLPSGFGPRSRLIEALFDSAESYGAEDGLLDSILEAFHRRESGLLALVEDPGIPMRYVDPWVSRIQSTMARLRSGGSTRVTGGAVP